MNQYETTIEALQEGIRTAGIHIIQLENKIKELKYELDIIRIRLDNVETILKVQT